MLRYILILAAVALGAVQLALIAAKLIGDVHWAWVWVLAPTWAPVVAVVVIAIVIVALIGNSSTNIFQ